jgi:hypothetical protein
MILMKKHVVQLPHINHFSALLALVKVPFSASLNSSKNSQYEREQWQNGR